MTGRPIETLDANDIDRLLDLWKDAGLPYRPDGRDSRDAILAQMAMPQCRFLGLRGDDGRLIGAALANHEGRKGWVNRIAVRRSARRAGVARALIAASEQWLASQGILLVAALVEGDNTSSQALFDACGYERDDTLVYFRKASGPGV